LSVVSDWNKERADLKEDLAHLVDNIKRRICGIASAGAGPAEITAGYELLKRTNIKPLIFEKSDYLGGISRTVEYKSNRIDLGGHKFYTKSQRVLDWWFSILPLEVEKQRDRVYEKGPRVDED
jgi:protoporphyrinogen oxidase